MTHDNRPASAVLRVGDRAPALLLGAPVACPPAEPGAAGIILGWTTTGEPVELTITTASWLGDLAQAMQDVIPQSFAGAGTAVTP